MAKTLVEMRGIDPLLFRDGRPFAAESGGLTADSLPLPLPPTVAAFLRTQIGRAARRTWNHDDCVWAHGIPVHGPLLVRDDKVVLPAPLDALLTESAVPIMLRPNEALADCCDLPDGLRPLAHQEEHQGKPPAGYHYWPAADLLRWLEGDAPDALEQIAGLPVEERIGIAMDAERGRAKEGLLYAARLRAFAEKTHKARHEYTLAARVNLPGGAAFTPSGTLGGERRLTTVQTVEDSDQFWPRCPPSLKEKLAPATRVRMVLATPAHFAEGWKPGWIAKSGSGEAHLPAGIASVGLRLVAAAVGRRVAVSGWSVRENKPRAVRWLAPAGSVYFFEVTGGNPQALFKDAWMKPVSDNEQDRRDGLGLALWGTW